MVISRGLEVCGLAHLGEKIFGDDVLPVVKEFLAALLHVRRRPLVLLKRHYVVLHLGRAPVKVLDCVPLRLGFVHLFCRLGIHSQSQIDAG